MTALIIVGWLVLIVLICRWWYCMKRREREEKNR